MPFQDLTPQLRTRLSRMERAVGWFILLATALLVFGFAYYVYHTAQRKGWFVTKAPYFTLIDRATGLKVGDPVKLMGFDVGWITVIEAQPPDNDYNVYVEFEIKSPHYGYLWTGGSRVRVNSADFLGKRELEVTKGTGGTATYVFHPLQEIPVSELAQLPSPGQWQLAEDIYAADEPVILFHAQKTALTPDAIAQLKTLGRTHVRLLDTRETRKSMTAVWNDRAARFDHFGRTNLYWLPADETPAVTERLERVVAQVEQSLPGVFVLTNQIALALNNAVELTSNFNTVALDLRPPVTNLSALSAQLRGDGALGAWLLSTEGRTNLNLSLARTPLLLTNANSVMTNVDATLSRLSENLSRSLDNLANITSNLNNQVQANTNLLTAISEAVIHADELVQGLKRHWLFRSAFKTKATDVSPVEPVAPLRSPRDADSP